MNVLRKYMAAEAAELKPLLDRAYHAIIVYQGERSKAAEARLRASLEPAIARLPVFKPYMPPYKQAYFDVLLSSWAELVPRDLIMLFDHCIDIMHLRLGREVPVNEASQPGSRALLNALDRRLDAPQRLPPTGEFACSGTAAVPGKASGPARVLAHGEGVAGVRPGEVLVCRMTRAEWVGAFDRAVALVTDLGGMACHAAIAAREFGLPCVTGCGDATSVIQTGEVIEVDGGLGLVTRTGEREVHG